MSPVRCGAVTVTVRDGRAKRDGDGGGVEAAAAVRLLCCFFHLFARSRAATSTYKAFFFISACVRC
jgi:hypothetical protein